LWKIRGIRKDKETARDGRPLINPVDTKLRY
jgi:hypothetical protein